jgi:sialidase-1
MAVQVLALASAYAPAIHSPAGVDIFTSGTEGYHCYRIPALLRLPGGQIAAYVEGRKFSCNDHDWNDIVFKTSADDGATWSPLRVAYSNSTSSDHVTIGNPSPVVINGAVVLVFCRNNKQVMTLRSADGIQWDGAPTDVTAQALGANWSARVDWIATGPPQGLVLPSSDGALAERIVIQANYRGSGTAADVGFAILSDDGGATWRPSAGVVPACNEGQVAPAQNGSLIMNCRTDGYHRLLSWSDDRGDSWSPPISWYFGPPGSGSPCEGSVVRASADLLAFSNNYGAGHGVENGCDRCNLTVWSSADSGETWSGISQVDEDPTVAGAYSALLALNASHVLLVYERGGSKTITLRTIALRP